MMQRSPSPQVTRRLTVVACAVLLGVVGCTPPPPQPTDPAAGPQFCPTTQVVYARGSGQLVNAKEARRFFNQLKNRNTDPDARYFELGTDRQTAFRYPAMRINKNVKITRGAPFSALNAGQYAHSVSVGVAELTELLATLHSTCAQTKIVLGGYSQGAHVISKALNELADQNAAVLPHVVAVTLFGDPMSSYPEGAADAAGIPPACRGRELSPWRFSVPSCQTHTGLLTSSNQYLPESVRSRVAAWCQSGDVVCGGSKDIRSWQPHFSYADEDGPIDQAAVWVTARLTGTPHLESLRFPIEHYYAQIGEQVNFTVPKQPSSRYLFDVWGDASEELTRQQPQQKFTYPRFFRGKTMVTSGTESASAEVTVTTQSVWDPLPGQPAAVTAKYSEDVVDVAWEPAQDGTLAWIVWVDNFPVGVTVGSPLTAQISELDRTTDHQIGVSGVQLDGVFGPLQTVNLPAEPGN